MLVGGAVRDLLRDRPPRDFDIATDASIEEIRAQFRNSKTIGKRFPIVHTYFGNEVVEISSLKGEQDQDKYALIYEDASRRDFTVNALYYDIVDFKIIDPLGALDDVLEGRVVSIGDAAERFEEDPIRMLRAVKLEAKQGFALNSDIETTIREHQDWTSKVGSGRRYEELTRVLLDDNVIDILNSCHKYGLFAQLWPEGDQFMTQKDLPYFEEVRDSVPIVYSRGSFAKQSHTHLWMRLFMDSSFYKPTTSATELKTQLARFLGPLGMPFQNPIVDTLLWTSHIRLKSGVNPRVMALTSETRELLSYFAEQTTEEEREAVNLFVANLRPEKKRRRKRPRRGKAKLPPENVATQPKAAEATEDGKPKRRRRRRRRSRKKAKATEN